MPGWFGVRYVEGWGLASTGSSLNRSPRGRQRPGDHGGQRGRLDAEHRIIVRAECGTDLVQASGSCCSLIDRSDPYPLGSSSSRRESIGPRDIHFAECLLCRAVQAVILGMIAQAVTGEPIQQLITQRILRPLDLTHTSFLPVAAPPHLPVQGYTVEGKDALPTSGFESPAELSWSGAAGAMISTVADLQVWAPATGPCCHHPCSASGCNWSLCRCPRINVPGGLR